jgi:hypothetical protein
LENCNPTTRAGIKIGVLIVGVLAATLLVHVAAIGYQHYRLHRLLQQLSAAGVPLLPADIIPPPVDDSRNAAIPLAAAFEQMRTAAEDPLHPLHLLLSAASPFGLAERAPGEGDDPGRDTAIWQDDAVRESLRDPRMRDIYTQLEAAAQLPSCRFPVAYDQGAAMELGHLSQIAIAVRLLLVRAAVTAQDNPGSAMHDLNTALSLAAFLRAEPLLASQFTRITGQLETVNCYYLLLPCLPAIPEDEAVRFTTLLAAEEPYQQTALAVEGERILLGSWLFEYLLWGKHAAAAEQIEFSRQAAAARAGSNFFTRFLRRPVLLKDYRIYLETMIRMQQLLQEPYWQSAARWRNIKWDKQVPASCAVSRMIMPLFARLHQQTALSAALTNLAAAATRLELEFNRQKSYPSELDVASGMAVGDTIDPFTGERFGYASDGAGFRLYSYGLNQEDDGGQWQLEDGRDDILWLDRIQPRTSLPVPRAAAAASDTPAEAQEPSPQ